MTDSTYQDMPAEEITAVLTEALRQGLARILIEQDQGPLLGDEEIDARIELLEQENLTLKRRARHNDFAQLAEPLRAAGQILDITLPETIPSDLGRRAVDLFRDLKDIEGKALDGEDARREASPFVARFSAALVQSPATQLAFACQMIGSEYSDHLLAR
ncbi:MAG: hypothetical protein ACU0B9_13740 [Limimaricola soesokkakensis]|uniref:hypothetical protein n=1 Tax=Limimaricola soesokkakensis TaxID=1343159 RepID=UPI004059138C